MYLRDATRQLWREALISMSLAVLVLPILTVAFTGNYSGRVFLKTKRRDELSCGGSLDSFEVKWDQGKEGKFLLQIVGRFVFLVPYLYWNLYRAGGWLVRVNSVNEWNEEQERNNNTNCVETQQRDSDPGHMSNMLSKWALYTWMWVCTSFPFPGII